MYEEKNRYSIRLADIINPNDGRAEKLGDMSPHTAREYVRRKRNILKKHYTSVNNTFAIRHGIYPIHSSGYSHYMVAELTPKEADSLRRDKDVISVTRFFEKRLITHQTDIISRQIAADSIDGSHSPIFPPYLGNGVRLGIISAQNLTFDPYSAQLDGLEELGRLVYLDGRVASEQSVHSSAVTSLVIGQSVTIGTEQYRGVVPQSVVYFAPSFTKLSVYEAIEKCLDNGAVVVNYSAGEAFPDGNYSDFDRQIDTLIYNVGFCFVTSAGNACIVSSPGTSYNGITVGNAITKGTQTMEIPPPYPMFYIREDDCSGYIQADYLPNKPDLAAPGTYIHYIDSRGNLRLDLYGTSFAAPYVTGVAAQIAEKYPNASLLPLVMKTLILAGADSDVILEYDNPTVSSSDILRVKSGAGFLNSANALGDIRFKSGVMLTDDTATHNLSERFELLAGQRVRILVCCMKSVENVALTFSRNNIVLEFYAPDSSRVAVSNSPRENVKLIEYTVQSSGVYTAVCRLELFDPEGGNIPYVLAYRIA